MEALLPNSRPVVVVTGAVGGLGSALSAGFAKNDFRVFVTDLHRDPLDSLIARIRDSGGHVCGDIADLASIDQTRAVIDRAVQTFGRIDVLINNAGVSSAKPIWDLNEADWDQVLSVNVKGTFFALQAAAKYMVHNGGSIINIASVAGRVGRPALLHYAASKAAVISITRSAAVALAKDNVRVNAIAPGMMDTDMLRELQSSLNSNNGPGNPQAHGIPLGRIARPEEIVATALFLAGEDSAYMTGQTLNVDGGIVMS
ncbi:MAG: SDR family NAD(P)-dependent oxidoreductase [Bryobacteraceae bacterium]